MLHVSKFGMLPNGPDCVGPWAAAVAAASVRSDKLVFDPGEYVFKSRPAKLDIGIVLQGDGAVGPSSNGTMLIADYDEPDPDAGFVAFTGKSNSPGSFRGDSGGVRDIALSKGPNKNGGTAIVHTTTGGKHSGWSLESNLLIFAYRQAGRWDHGLLYDGMGTSPPGPQGLRNPRLSNVEVTGCRIPGESVVFRNVVNARWVGGLVMPAGDSVVPGILVTGGNQIHLTSQSVWLTSIDVHGKVKLEHVNGFKLEGRFVSVTVENTASAGKIDQQPGLAAVVNNGVNVRVV